MSGLIVSVIVFLPIFLKTIFWPGPPLYLPAPHESTMISFDTTLTGHLDSIISEGVTILLCGYAEGYLPSEFFIAPKPPCGNI